MSPKISERMIRAMSPQSREARYTQEKNELYRNNMDKPAAWLEAERMKLQKKWRI